MATKSKWLRHLINGGFATDLGGRAEVEIRGNIVLIPFLDTARNIVYKLDNSIGKTGGTAKINATALESGATVKGVFDYWNIGTSNTPAQHRIVHVGTTIKKDDGDGTFTNLFTGLELDKNPCYSVLEDLLVISSDSTTDVPKSWDGTTAQSLAGSPPNFSFSCIHKGRLWASGNAAAPGKLYYTGRFNSTNWSGSGSGEFNINPRDGDKVTAIVSHKGRLWIFKGPYKGSIHVISGSAPTGPDPFRLDIFQDGIGAVNHSTIFEFQDDVGFVSPDGTVNSIKNIGSEGLFKEAALSFPIHTWIAENVVFSSLHNARAMSYIEKGVILFGIPVNGSTENNYIIGMDFRFSEPRWFTWPSFKNMATAMTTMIDPSENNRRRLVLGGNDGYIRHAFENTMTLDDGTNIDEFYRTPYIDYNMPENLKTITGGYISAKVVGNSNGKFRWQRDSNPQQEQDVSISSDSARLAPVSTGTAFTLDQSALGGDSHGTEFFDLETGGEFRAIRYSIFNNNDDDTLDVDMFGVRLEIGGEATENV